MLLQCINHSEEMQFVDTAFSYMKHQETNRCKAYVHLLITKDVTHLLKHHIFMHFLSNILCSLNAVLNLTELFLFLLSFG